ncbi:Asp-tRNA(Asn)/Glu-tRNA(Gln) amidotransferase subunit GatA [Dechloromonas sp.]|uniref:Asp-tRNA(Asn)/Glu-tRNA(Gln) amidotransferase subunit GatA n=1 Tax=Dechloromonas sp. TaxID=1917218 RepID=UPI00121D3762|nr:Asp-tRNA(Asn)/Glu-tRNA(Gln) amidotransferase subunit GatA [Dechloromonas sp.]MBU3695250.1 Asp-tRNA(Asn)/Glu-tRNA(Gln) amidotransferase subunit GatA [Dechloromonas sp.]TEX47749.1 MAG: Asp-tRNA(Asn)/Glu-tRNA(Gln) amidotransferase GatCAB subunit A [Rhodocyclaceae bacterium]
MINTGLKELSQALAAKKISSVELSSLFLDRIERLNPDLNAFVTVDREKSLKSAADADARLAAGTAGALTGIPIAQKDIFCAEGWTTTCGSKMLANFVAPYDATVIEKLHAQAGMVSLGKTNMDEFAMGSSNETSYFGPVKNPWDRTRVPGGSSGGSAAAVAARLAPVATGTDTGGSIRQPAGLCNLTGLKPTYGVVSRYGMIAYASSLDQGGPMAQSAEDCALLLNAMAGFDPRDSTSLERPAEDYARDLDKPLAGLRIGLPKEFFAAGCDAGVMAAVQAAIKEYEKLGAAIVDVSLPNSHLSVPAYYVIAPAEASSNLSRYDGVRFGYRAPEYGNLDDMYMKTRAQGFGAEVKRRILIGAYVLSHGYYDAYYLQAQRIRRLIANDFVEAFKSCDVIMGPTSPTTAFRLGEKSADPVQMYLSDIYTIAVNLAGLPGMSVPCGFADDLPVGLQLIGNYFDEARLLGVAHRYQMATDWHRRLPGGID